MSIKELEKLQEEPEKVPEDIGEYYEENEFEDEFDNDDLFVEEPFISDEEENLEILADMNAKACIQLIREGDFLSAFYHLYFSESLPDEVLEMTYRKILKYYPTPPIPSHIFTGLRILCLFRIKLTSGGHLTRADVDEIRDLLKTRNVTLIYPPVLIAILNIESEQKLTFFNFGYHKLAAYLRYFKKRNQLNDKLLNRFAIATELISNPLRVCRLLLKLSYGKVLPNISLFLIQSHFKKGKYKKIENLCMKVLKNNCTDWSWHDDMELDLRMFNDHFLYLSISRICMIKGKVSLDTINQLKKMAKIADNLEASSEAKNLLHEKQQLLDFIQTN